MSYNVREHSYVVGGLGVTGQACVRFLLQKQATVKAFDTRANFTLVTDPDSDIDTDMHAFMAEKVTCTALSEDYFDGVDTLVLSPGLALDIEQVALAQKCGVEVIGDVELFARLNASTSDATPAKRVVGITGSNGKTTVTLLVNHLLKKCGVKSIEAGNVGRPVLEALQSDADVVVMELSSFQLETTSSLVLEAATVLNISDDHLDRHGTLEAYIDAKHRIFDNAKSAVVWRDGEFVAPYEQLITDAKGIAASNAVSDGESNAASNEESLASKNIVEYGLGESTTGFAIASFDGDDSARDNEQSLYITFKDEKLIALSDIHLAGMHNVLNIMAALGICLQLGVSPALAVKHLHSFKAAPHRCVEIARVNDIRYIDDSKATNIGATVAALEGLAPTIQGKLILIAGGDAKGADIASLSPYLTKYVSHVFALGKDAHLFEKSFAHTTRVATMKDAVKAATRLAAPGDVVLLSPACASLDMFKNYMHRGDVFKQDVHDLLNLHSKSDDAVEATS
ncbi:UDP-N-acetylmuramoyl-L-alanine--D-glutamate ligase [Alteromonas sp. 07-89-2]|uniref:UDP-N-acetylmuramoyl-L-alanine--D-glutamate ligase n=1 Tax=Alteromonas TaxID=226 RepID=UPI00148CF9AD|nr:MULTISPECIES: UDP-N-acetylmuramoyl-L-alanine--D-glutamate ligase [Alteromonas]MCG7636991.1 UDP-N-acetylmuramoyl-L-alanine--D-glutamate ligase [Alteromonas sp. CNT1-28]MCG7813952.1 UDP-N-acetylmuramoyl-L-alanine--D-glutamate ligase [Alteromonas sp. MCA-1]MCZ4241842.1 UDP-N-acetylmuramoyl-L-alanine--D-glutamate ligase [Alteromonas macleodii]NOH58536.1 UDP-N-acetylmuramoyl-L-alanine--D-glutamate ligase [Alteromonas sp. 07-89-2]